MKEHTTEKTKTKKAVSERPRAPKPEDREDASPAELAQGIEQTRAEMTDTLAAIERKLAPSELRAKAIEELEVVEDKVREVVREQIQETKESVKAELREAKEAVKEEVREAVGAVKEEVREAFGEAKQALHDATIGKAKTMAKQASETMIETSDTFVDTVKRNPIPAAMVGIGLAWLFMNRSRGNTRRVQYRELGSRERGYTLDSNGRPYDPSFDLSRGGVAESLSQAKDSAGRLIDRAQSTASHAAHDARDAAGNFIHQIGDTAGHAVDQVKSTASSAVDTVKTSATSALDTVKSTATSAADTVKTTATDLAHRASDQATHLKEYAGERAHFVADKGREGYHFAEERFEDTLEENPLALGAVALAIGAAIGLAIPKTERENKLFGPYREQLFDTAREYAHEAVGQLHTMGEQAGEQVRGQLGQAMKPS